MLYRYDLESRVVCLRECLKDVRQAQSLQEIATLAEDKSNTFKLVGKLHAVEQRRD